MLDDETVAWVKWAMKKADWFDLIVARDDELFSEREHKKRLRRLLKKLDIIGDLNRLVCFYIARYYRTSTIDSQLMKFDNTTIVTRVHISLQEMKLKEAASK